MYLKRNRLLIIEKSLHHDRYLLSSRPRICVLIQFPRVDGFQCCPLLEQMSTIFNVLSLNTMVLSYKGSQLYYSKHGQGSKVLLLFHGFGQDHSAFQSIIQQLAPSHQCFSFDLYFHGQSVWPGERPLEKEEWKEIMSTFLSDNAIEKFSVLGFSMGGKFALATAEAFPEKITQLILIAADGVKTSTWYKFATYPLLTRKLFKSMIKNHNRFLTIAKALHSMGLLSKSLLRFAESQMNTEEVRNRVYYSWVVFRHLTFDLEKLTGLLNQHHVEVSVVVGRFDKVIPYQAMDAFVKKLNHGKLEVLEVSHHQVLRASESFLKGL